MDDRTFAEKTSRMEDLAMRMRLGGYVSKMEGERLVFEMVTELAVREAQRVRLLEES